MNRLTLNAAAYIRLGAQLNLNGTFHHTLRNDQRVSMAATVAIEQCGAAICAQINISRSRHSITLDRSKTAAMRLAGYIESIANGEGPIGMSEPGEEQLAQSMEVALRKAIRTGQGTHYLPIEGLDGLLVAMHKGNTGRIVADIQAEHVSLQVLLPRNPAEAYAMLADNVERFISGHRAALAA